MAQPASEQIRLARDQDAAMRGADAQLCRLEPTGLMMSTPAWRNDDLLAVVNAANVEDPDGAEADGNPLQDLDVAAPSTALPDDSALGRRPPSLSAQKDLS